MQRRHQIDSKEKAIALARAAWDKKALNTVLIEVKSLSDITDYMVICSADTDRGVKTIVDNIRNTVEELNGEEFWIEGYSEGRWVLIDVFDVIVHVFYEPLREFYDIEGLWIDTPRIELPFEDEFPVRSGHPKEDYA